MGGGDSIIEKNKIGFDKEKEGTWIQSKRTKWEKNAKVCNIKLSK